MAMGASWIAITLPPSRARPDQRKDPAGGELGGTVCEDGACAESMPVSLPGMTRVMRIAHAHDRRRWLPAQRIGRRPRRRTDTDAVELAGLHLADVGAANEGVHPGVSRDSLRPPGPWQIPGA